MKKENGDFDEAKLKSKKREIKRGRKKQKLNLRKNIGSKKIDKENAKKNRFEENKLKIKNHIWKSTASKSSEEIDMWKKVYSRWIRDSLEAKEPILSDGDIKTETMTSSKGAGGQGRDRGQDAVRLTHLPTGISAKSEERGQEKNIQEAKGILYEKLTDHLAVWSNLAKDGGITSPEELISDL